MAQRLGPQGPQFGVPTVGAGLSGAAVATVLTYTVPTGRNALVRYAGVNNFSGAPTVQVRATVGGVTVVLGSGAGAYDTFPNLALNAADTLTIRVTAAIALSTFDATISADEFLLA